jgi:hypothetical protein
MGLAMVISVSVLPTFADRPILWRDASTGMSMTSLYFARICVSLIDASFLTTLYALVYWLCVQAGLDQTRCQFYVYLFPCMCLGWAAAAWGYLISVTASPRNSTLLTLVIMMILTQVIGNPSLVVENVVDPSILDLLSVSPTRWSVPMQFTLYHDGRGFHDPPLPDCSDFVDGRCPPAAGMGSRLGLPATPGDCDKAMKSKLEGYMLNLVKSQQTRLSYVLLASDAPWFEDGVALIISGILLHLVALLLLSRQSPAASSLAGSTLSGLFRGRLFRPAQPHTCSDGRDSSSGVRQNTLNDLEAASDPSPLEAES